MKNIIAKITKDSINCLMIGESKSKQEAENELRSLILNETRQLLNGLDFDYLLKDKKSFNVSIEVE